MIQSLRKECDYLNSKLKRIHDDKDKVESEEVNRNNQLRKKLLSDL